MFELLFYIKDHMSIEKRCEKTKVLEKTDLNLQPRLIGNSACGISAEWYFACFSTHLK